MPRLHFTPHLREFFALPEAVTVAGADLESVLRALDARWPGLAFYITDERWRTLREHVAVWVDGTRLPREAPLETPLADDAVVHIMQALSGG